MRVSNDAERTGGPSGAFAEMFRLQSEFQARLAEETLRYLRRLQGAVVPAAPGTVVLPDDALELRAAGTPGGRVEVSLEVENLQRVHSMVTPQLTPLVSAAGVTWFPETGPGADARLVAPNAVERVAIPVAVPAELPEGEYRGALVLQGFRSNSLPVCITVQAAGGASSPAPEPAAPSPSPPTGKRTGGKKRGSTGSAGSGSSAPARPPRRRGTT